MGARKAKRSIWNGTKSAMLKLKALKNKTKPKPIVIKDDDIDERIVEIAAPAGGSDDVMSMVDSKDERE